MPPEESLPMDAAGRILPPDSSQLTFLESFADGAALELL
jgi:hypothetical protein